MPSLTNPAASSRVAPIFILSSDFKNSDEQVAALTRLLGVNGSPRELSSPDLLAALFDLGLEAQRLWKQYIAALFSNLTQEFPLYALSRFDVESLRCRILTSALVATGGQPVCPLPADASADFITLLRKTFPAAKFLCVGAPVASLFADADACVIIDPSILLGNSESAGAGSQFAQLRNALNGASPRSIDATNQQTGFPPSSDKPLFILGAARSGTSVVTAALKEAAGFEGWDEGHLLPFIGALLECLEEIWRTEKIGVSFSAIKSAVLEEAHRAYKSTGFGSRWLEKTPDYEMISQLPLIKEIYPNAKFIYVQRDPITCVLSRQKKFGQSVVQAAQLWRASVEAWQAVKPRLNPAHFLELEQSQFTSHSEQVGEKLARFLTLGENARHGISLYLRMQRPQLEIDPELASHLQQLSSSPARISRLQMILGKLLDAYLPTIDGTGWTAEEKMAFENIAGPLAEQLGYALNGGAKQKPRDAQLARLAADLESLENRRFYERFHKLIKLISVAAALGFIVTLAGGIAFRNSAVPLLAAIFSPSLLALPLIAALPKSLSVAFIVFISVQNAGFYAALALFWEWFTRRNSNR